MIKLLNVRHFALLWVASTILAVPAHAQPGDFDSYVGKVLREFQVPGMGIAIVKDGKVVLAKGYGVRSLEGNAPADEHTLFAIASNSKAFTATSIGMLVEEGKLEWDAPVINYLPAFRLSNPYVTSELTVRDLLVHRSGLGLGSGDLLWWPPSTYDRKEIVRRLRYLPLASSFRSTYAYDNVLYLVAGELIEAVSGQTWEEFVATRILGKIGMTGSKVRHSDISAGGDVATPHARVNGKVQVVKPFTSDNTNPAGGIVTNAYDIAKWMIVQLDSGRVPGGGRLFSPQTTRQLWTIVTPMPIGTPPPELRAVAANFNGYGLGFHIRDYRGVKLVTHTGGLPGFVSEVSMIPEIKLGVAVLTNAEADLAFQTITNYVLDYYLHASDTDWLTVYSRLSARADSIMHARESAISARRDTSSRPSLPLERYAGTYADRWYGNIVISEEHGHLVMSFSATPALVGDLEHWQYDTFLVRWRDRELRADAFVTFSLNPDGTIREAKMRPESPATDFSFDFQDLLLKPVGR